MSAIGHVEREAALQAEVERLRAEFAAIKRHANIDIAEAVLAERERCARIVENWWKRHWHTTPAPCEATSNEIAAAIRKGE